MKSVFSSENFKFLIFGLWSLGALRLQALVPASAIQNFAIECLKLEDPDDQVVDITLQHFAIQGENLGIYFVTTANKCIYVIKVIKLASFSPNHLDDFRGSQLIYQRLQDMQVPPPPNVRFALTRYCQVVGGETIFGIEDEFPPDEKRNLMLWMPKASGKPIDSLRINAEENPEARLQSIAQADTLLYQMGICLDHALNPGRIRWDSETGVLTIVNTAGVKNIRDIPFPKYNMIGTWHLPNMLMVHPGLLNMAVSFYEDPTLRQHIVRSVKCIMADRFDYTVTHQGRRLSLDQIMALINQYRGMGLIPDRVGIRARLLFNPILEREELVSIWLTNLPDEDKAALRSMHEQRISKADAQCGNADSKICTAFRHYQEKTFCCKNGQNIPIWNIIQYGQITEAEVALCNDCIRSRSLSMDKYRRSLWNSYNFTVE
ncbi:MAG: hypothetical protein LBH52_02610 [Puniceicoccales bacterium]|jgi:hypothetical protein|nr:hypothetical protein [Puniceicoccales bacterium]